MKKLVLGLTALVLVLTVFANAVELGGSGDCSPRRSFWGSNCCVYWVDNELGASTGIKKCCTQRFWINWSCDDVEQVWP